MTKRIRCAICENGPFTQSVAPPTHDRVVDGYYFCAWCHEHHEWNRFLHPSKDAALVAQADEREAVRAYPKLTSST